MGTFIIVEGKTDATKLKSIFPGLKIIETGGSGITTEKLELIKKISLHNKVIIFTDPDYPGQKLRQMISDYLDNNCLHAFINKSDAIKGKKVGVAEASVVAIKNSINNLITFRNENKDSLLWPDYINLVDSKLKRQKIINYYNLAPTNNKATFKCLNYMNVTKHALIKILEEK
ncbi:ribonuclease M5 [Spiroplasma sp. SV19]|uniref:ribonuclease M5 n=1 Tax=Spiroplasma sp. SV19 TaxID=2570468 RepID=UPI0024B70B1E|nr:ribonuclease M5 [Spiroplasma sp. SV19]WHQ37163.1 ribonuclease M5 [Spiroplasma sp. SV19]